MTTHVLYEIASELNSLNDNAQKSVCIIGSGAAGLITAKVLLDDGFSNLIILTKDASPGGVWEHKKVYTGVYINNLYGDYRFSSQSHSERGGQVSAEDMQFYMEKFAETFLKDRICYNTEVLDIARPTPPFTEKPSNWLVTVRDKTGVKILGFDRIVLCTGGCNEPRIPGAFTESEALMSGFKGPVVHSSDFRSRLEEILAASRPKAVDRNGTIVVIGGGKSAQDIASYLANEGRVENVVMIYEKTDAFIASNTRLPDSIRQSRLLGILSPHRELRTGLERFLHTTWLGGRTVRAIFNHYQTTSLDVFDIPEGSPLRLSQDMFWSLRVNDEVSRRRTSFHTLVNEGKIQIVAPARVIGFGPDGASVELSDGRIVDADGIILATGYKSSWSKIFTKNTYNTLGLGIYPPQYASDNKFATEWNYTSLRNPPPSHPRNREWSTHIYRGIVPSRNILRRDFAINGAVFSTNNGYVFETTAHWISSYFLSDHFLKIPSTAREAIQQTERASAWLRKRYPDMLHWTNESHCSEIAFWSWPQYVDDLLDDMSLPSGRKRTGGNWFTWPLKPIDIRSIANLGGERRQNRYAQD